MDTTDLQQKDQTYLKESFWVVLGGVSLFYYTALFDYSPTDPSYYSVSAPEIGQVTNITGKIGAEISAHFFTWFGVSSYLIPLLF